MSRFDADIITRPDLRERLQGIDPWVFQVLMTPELADRISAFEAGVINADSLVVRQDGGEAKEYSEPCVCAYAEDGTIVHIRQTSSGEFAAVVANLENGTLQQYGEVTRRYFSQQNFGLPSETGRMEYVLYQPPNQPVLASVEGNLEKGVLAYAAHTLSSQSNRFVVTTGSKGWFYKPAGSIATTGLQDWSNFCRQRELIGYRGFDVTPREVGLETFSQSVQAIDNSV